MTSLLHLSKIIDQNESFTPHQVYIGSRILGDNKNTGTYHNALYRYAILPANPHNLEVKEKMASESKKIFKHRLNMADDEILEMIINDFGYKATK